MQTKLNNLCNLTGSKVQRNFTSCSRNLNSNFVSTTDKVRQNTPVKNPHHTPVALRESFYLSLFHINVCSLMTFLAKTNAPLFAFLLLVFMFIFSHLKGQFQ